MSSFLEDLKKAADSGEFNSEAAKKIIEINSLAKTKLSSATTEGVEELKQKVEKRYESSVEPITEEQVLEANSEYEKKMEGLRKTDMVNGQVAMLIDIEDMVKASVDDMFSFVKELETKFEKPLEENDVVFATLKTKLEEINKKYKSIINN